MSEDESRRLDQGDPDDDFQPSDLPPLRAVAEREELADARAPGRRPGQLPECGRSLRATCARRSRSAHRGRAHSPQLRTASPAVPAGRSMPYCRFPAATIPTARAE